MVGASGAGLALVLPEFASADRAALPTEYVGQVEEVLGPGDATVRFATQEPVRRVTLQPGADVVHGLGAIGDLSAFVPKEIVAAHVVAFAPDGTWRVDRLHSIFQTITTRIADTKAGQIETGSGSFAHAPVERRAARPPARGATVDISYWTDPRSGRRFAAAVTPR
jgi:hypothetical protein